MKARFSTVERSVIGGVVAMLILFSVITLSVFWTAKNSSNNFVKQELLEVTARLQESCITNFIKDFEKIFNYSYEKINAEDVRNLTNLDFYDKEWSTLKTIENDIHMIFFANEEGKIFTIPEWTVPDSYDPRIRPWYMPAKLDQDKINVEYYTSKACGKALYSMSRAVKHKEGKVIGVFAIDITLDALKSELQEITRNSILKVYIIENNRVIATDTHTNITIPELKEGEAISAVLTSEKMITHLPDQGGFWVKKQLSYPKNWQIIVNICDAKINKRNCSILHTTYVILLIQLIAGLFFIKFVLSTLRQQVVGIHDTLAASLAKARGDNTFNTLHRGEEVYHGIYSKISEHNRVLQETQEKVDIDALTKSYSRRAYNRDMRQLLEEHEPFFHIILDFDDFKMINDSLGHTMGDELLKYFSSFIIVNTRKHDKLYRYGGDEFVIICDGKDTISVERRMTQLLNNFSRQLKKDLGVDITVSFGVSYCSGEEKLSELINSCDQELYQRKRTKKSK